MKGNNLKNKSIGILCGYMIFYLVSFFLLEKLPVRQVIIHCRLDEMIPFCEYFIIPYVLWFFFIAGTVLYFLLFNESSGEYARLVGTLGTGMTIFIIVSFVCPNRHMLRPNLTEDGIFIDAVRILYRIDTPTNIFPSIHVFNTAACYLALRKNEKCRKNKKILFWVGVLSVSIILSTMFLKQHTVIDVAGALVLNWICYGIFYKWMPENREFLSRILRKEQILTVPNMLSLFRMGTAVVFWGMSERLPYAERQVCLVGILMLSLAVDYVTRRMEKKYQTENQAGKLLKFAADRITQGVILLYLMARYRMLDVLFVIFFMREVLAAFTHVKEFVKEEKGNAVLRYEKINAAVFDAMLLILMFVPGITKSAANFLIFISEIFMGGSLLMYLHYSREMSEEKEERC